MTMDLQQRRQRHVLELEQAQYCFTIVGRITYVHSCLFEKALYQCSDSFPYQAA
jgi:hypothetical protein